MDISLADLMSAAAPAGASKQGRKALFNVWFAVDGTSIGSLTLWDEAPNKGSSALNERLLGLGIDGLAAFFKKNIVSKAVTVEVTAVGTAKAADAAIPKGIMDMF